MRHTRKSPGMNRHIQIFLTKMILGWESSTILVKLPQPGRISTSPTTKAQKRLLGSYPFFPSLALVGWYILKEEKKTDFFTCPLK